MTNELLQALLDTPPVDAAIRWHDGTDLRAETIALAVMAEPTAGRQYLEALRLCLERSESLDELGGQLYYAGTYFGAHGGAEAAALLWSLADAITASLSQEGHER
jgi:hypothetical protein